MTNLYLTTVAADTAVTAGSGTKWKAGWSAGASARTVTKKCTNPSGTPSQMTDGAATTDGTLVSWYTEPLTAVTITGAITCTMWTFEIDTSTNARQAIRVEQCAADGTVLSTIVPSSLVNGTEMPATAAVQTFSITAGSVVDTTILGGQRLHITLYMASTALSTTTTRYAQYGVNGATGATGSSQLAFAESLTVLVPDATVTMGSALAVTAAQPAPAVTEFAPALELSGFTISGPGGSDTIEYVQVTVAQFQSSALMGAPRIELWDGTSAQIGADVFGAVTTSTGNVDTFTITGVTYSQLATLRVRVYANSGAAAAGATQSVDSVGLAVCYSPGSGGTDATVTMGSAKAVTTTFPAPTVTAASNATVTMGSALAVATTQPAVTVTATSNATAAPATRAVATAQPLPTVTAVSNAAATPATVSRTCGPAAAHGHRGQ